ncbi:MAG TPA: hypothetical protein VFD51_03845 [Patescibacteria group bacterium]|nr:hypothetical protein [Patescibacteria group bacterium]
MKKKKILGASIAVIVIVLIFFGGKLFLQKSKEAYRKKNFADLKICQEICNSQRGVVAMDCIVDDMVLSIEQFCLMYYNLDLQK